MVSVQLNKQSKWSTSSHNQPSFLSLLSEREAVNGLSSCPPCFPFLCRSGHKKKPGEKRESALKCVSCSPGHKRLCDMNSGEKVEMTREKICRKKKEKNNAARKLASGSVLLLVFTRKRLDCARCSNRTGDTVQNMIVMGLSYCVRCFASSIFQRKG